MRASKIFFIAKKSPEGGFYARAIGHSIFTQAETKKELFQVVKDAVRCHFEEQDLPESISLNIVEKEQEEVIPV